MSCFDPKRLHIKESEELNAMSSSGVAAFAYLLIFLVLFYLKNGIKAPVNNLENWTSKVSNSDKKEILLKEKNNIEEINN